ncbi:MAG: spermidine synthase, partial [Candidatus Chisholmbacteria bacterium]|nr:spermidine synthase [Candidatus Chisholmbacteria bacterium]
SFLILFLELALIRFIPAHIKLVGYFTNLILLGTFLGLGLGLLLVPKRSAYLPLFPLLLALLLGFVIFSQTQVDVTSSNVIFFTTKSGNTAFKLEPNIILPIIYLLVTLVFIPLSQHLGRLFKKLPPLTAYSVDITGALFGIILFSTLSALSLPPPIWFAIITIAFLSITTWYRLLSLFILAAIILITALTNRTSLWSPYYRLEVVPFTSGYGININGIPHQFISDYAKREALYFAPFDLVKNPSYRKALIIGPGTGADVATLLGEHPQIEQVDAVDINPTVVSLGQKLHPNRPYADPRVRIHITDGRNFLQNSPQKYDLIVFGLPDSLILTSGTGHIRLESFLFTQEAFELVKNHLTDTGLFVMYNFYRQNWLIDKLALTLKIVFDQPIYVLSYGDINKTAILMAGPKTVDVTSDIKPRTSIEPLPIATDDWPFPYLRLHFIPPFYLRFLSIILLISLFAVFLATRVQKFYFDWKFFFLGAGFMLLETKHLVTFGLLFGTTWLVNSLVFAAILTSVLLANLTVSRFRPKNIWPFYVTLFLILIANYLLPPAIFFPLPLAIRYIAASVFYFSPIFLANLIFAQLFKQVKNSPLSFGSNLLGALFGGLTEYLALITGYKFLLLLIIGFYALSLIPLPQKLWIGSSK